MAFGEVHTRVIFADIFGMSKCFGPEALFSGIWTTLGVLEMVWLVGGAGTRDLVHYVR